MTNFLLKPQYNNLMNYEFRVSCSFVSKDVSLTAKECKETLP